MSRLFTIAIFLIIAGGLAIHAGVEFPRFLRWVGTLPGDLILKKEGLTIYLPLTSSLLISVVLSLVLSVFKK